MILKKLCLSIFTVVFLFACNEKKIVDHDTMVKTYVDIMINQEIYKNHKDSLRIKVDEVFAENKITEGEYLQTLDSYYDDKEKWDLFFNESLALVDSMRIRDNVTKPGFSPSRSEFGNK